MYTYDLLETGCYYLIKEKVDSGISLIKVSVETDHCLYILIYNDPLVTEWKQKTDSIHDIIECLTDETVKQWEKQYTAEDAYLDDDDE